MANTDKNILITPNKGQADDPVVEFSGADASTGPQIIRIKAYPTSNGTLSFEGSAGQLFSITNDLSGTIFSVNDVSGIPSIEVNADGTVKVAEYSGNVLVGTAIDNGTDKFQVNGGVAATSFTGNGASLTNLNASNISTGTVSTARLGSGTASTSTWLRGDGSWQVGPLGYTGSQGIQGVTGFSGSRGFTGSAGSNGATGFTGSVGLTGFTGSASTVQGPTGFTGSRGFTGSASTVQGPIGFTGSRGFTGSASTVQGPTGFTGSVGFTGSQGIQGVTGFTGSRGFTGSVGFTGSQGIQGVTGFTGSQGIQGVTGFTGSRGFTGSASTVQGPTGFTGSRGFTGSAGPGITGGGSDLVFVENNQTVTTNYTITSGKNALSTGPITINDGVTVTIPDGSRWVIL